MRCVGHHCTKKGLRLEPLARTKHARERERVIGAGRQFKRLTKQACRSPVEHKCRARQPQKTPWKKLSIRTNLPALISLERKTRTACDRVPLHFESCLNRMTTSAVMQLCCTWRDDRCPSLLSDWSRQKSSWSCAPKGRGGVFESVCDGYVLGESRAGALSDTKRPPHCVHAQTHGSLRVLARVCAALCCAPAQTITRASAPCCRSDSETRDHPVHPPYLHEPIRSQLH